MLHQRIQEMTKLMIQQKRGCIRFKFGRDWNMKDFQTEENAKEMSSGKISYTAMLAGKEDLFKKLQFRKS